MKEKINYIFDKLNQISYNNPFSAEIILFLGLMSKIKCLRLREPDFTTFEEVSV